MTRRNEILDQFRGGQRNYYSLLIFGEPALTELRDQNACSTRETAVLPFFRTVRTFFRLDLLCSLSGAFSDAIPFQWRDFEKTPIRTRPERRALFLKPFYRMYRDRDAAMVEVRERTEQNRKKVASWRMTIAAQRNG